MISCDLPANASITVEEITILRAFLTDEMNEILDPTVLNITPLASKHSTSAIDRDFD